MNGRNTSMEGNANASEVKIGWIGERKEKGFERREGSDEDVPVLDRDKLMRSCASFCPCWASILDIPD